MHEREQKERRCDLGHELETREVHKFGNAVWVPLLGAFEAANFEAGLPVHAVPRDFPAMSASGPRYNDS